MIDASNLGCLRKVDVPLPAVLKRNSSESLQRDSVRTGGKTVYAYSREELVAAAERELALSPQILVQEFIDGYGVGVSGIFDNGSPVALFGHRRIRESTPTGGPSAVAASIPLNGVLRDATCGIMSQTDYTGSAMIEFKVSRSTGIAYLMEIKCHAAERDVLLYRDLTQYLDPDQPVYGLQSENPQSVVASDPRIEDIAAKYVL